MNHSNNKLGLFRVCFIRDSYLFFVFTINTPRNNGKNLECQGDKKISEEKKDGYDTRECTICKKQIKWEYLDEDKCYLCTLKERLKKQKEKIKKDKKLREKFDKL